MSLEECGFGTHLFCILAMTTFLAWMLLSVSRSASELEHDHGLTLPPELSAKASAPSSFSTPLVQYLNDIHQSIGHHALPDPIWQTIASSCLVILFFGTPVIYFLCNAQSVIEIDDINNLRDWTPVSTTVVTPASEVDDASSIPDIMDIDVALVNDAYRS
jgi:PIG-P